MSDIENKRAGVAKLIKELGVQATDSIEDCDVALVTNAADFDKKANDEFWQEHKNRSAVRDIPCSWCGDLVAMSHWLYEKYTISLDKIRLCCNRCVPAIIKEIEKEK